MNTQTQKEIQVQFGFPTESQAREFARNRFGNKTISIIHSPNPHNTNGDYYVDASDYPFVRNWEKELFKGKGAKA